MSDEKLFTDSQRTRSVRYRTEDAIQNLRIKVILQVSDPEDNAARLSGGSTSKERTFSWQDKVFGPSEYDHYMWLLDKEAKEADKKGNMTNEEREKEERKKQEQEEEDKKMSEAEAQAAKAERAKQANKNVCGARGCARCSAHEGHGRLGISSGTHVSPLDKKYMKEVKHREKEVLFSYVDVDPFEDREEYTESVTTSQDEKPTALAIRTQKTELSRGKFSKSGLGKEICKPFQVMYICAEVKGRRDPCSDPKKLQEQFLQEEVILCRIRAYKDEGIVDMCPAFSPKAPIKVDIMRGASYTQEQLGTGYQIRATGSRFSYVYWIFNDTEPEDTALTRLERTHVTAIAAKLLHRQLKFQEELLNKALEMRRNLIADDFDSFSDTPNTDQLKCVLNLEIMSAFDFDLDLLYVHYELDVPDTWTVGDPSGGTANLCGNTVQAIVRYEKKDGQATLSPVAHFGHPVEVVLWKKNQTEDNPHVPPSAAPTPTLLMQVSSYDRWDRQRVQGYGHLAINCERSGHQIQEVNTWVPTASQIGKMRTFFIGGSAELKDLSFAGHPPGSANAASRYGFATESSGFVRVRINTLVQGPKIAGAPAKIAPTISSKEHAHDVSFKSLRDKH